jgi:hypothetical protein
MMRIRPTLGILILMLLVVSCPVQAFTAKNLDITIQDSTDATITFGYDLSWYENVAVFAQIADPNAELVKAIRNLYGKNVEVTSVTGNQVQMRVPQLASRTTDNGMVTLKTPALSLRSAQKALDKYWFARFVNPDFSPEVTTVSFPDGYSEVFYNQDVIPVVSHTLIGSPV